MSYRAAGVQTARARTTPASLELNEAKPARTERGWGGGSLSATKKLRRKNGCKAEFTSTIKPSEGVYRGLPNPRGEGLSGTGMALLGHRGAAVRAGSGRGVEGLKQAGGRLVQRGTPFLARGLHSIHSYVLAVKSLKKNLFFVPFLEKCFDGFCRREGCSRFIFSVE